MSCLASPAQLLMSPAVAKAGQHGSTAGGQQQQQQQPGGKPAAACGGSTAGADLPPRPASAADFRTLFQSFREGGSADAAGAAAAAAPSGVAAAATAGAAAGAADAGSGPVDQAQEDDLCQYLLGSGSDSWLVPPASAGTAHNAGPCAGTAGQPATGAAAQGAKQGAPVNTVAAAAAAARQEGGGGSEAGAGKPAAGTKGAKVSSTQQAATAANSQKGQNGRDAAGRAAASGAKPSDAQPTRKSTRAGAGQGGRRATLGTKQQQPKQQGQQGEAFNPDKPFAALFPSSSGSKSK